MNYGSVCSGIEAATMAWHRLGWRASFVSEIEAFPRAVLKHRWPEIPCHGDFTTIQAGDYAPIDLLVGGTPCQSFSLAGLRGGLDDDRGNLALEFLRLADRLRPRWLVWENVPGVLSSNGGRDFGAILGGMVQLGYGFAYRVLDARHFGVPQRRRRVFVVGYLGDWRRAAAVLFERANLSGDHEPRQATGSGVARTLSASTGGASAKEQQYNFVGADGQPLNPLDVGDSVAAFGGNNTRGPIEVAPALLATDRPRFDFESDTFIAQAFKASHYTRGKDGAPADVAPALSADADRGDQDTLVFALRGREGGAMPEGRQDAASALRASSGGSSRDYVAIPINADALRGEGLAVSLSPDARGRRRRRNPGLGIGRAGDPAGTVKAAAPGAVAAESGVRRLTPRECERLQGFPDDYTRIPWNGWRPMARGETPELCRADGLAVRRTKTGKWRVNDVDGTRYKALGNSMAVPVMAWLGRRIDAVERLFAEDGE